MILRIRIHARFVTKALQTRQTMNDIMKGFTNLFNLTRHKKDKHASTKEEFACKLCDITFTRLDTLFRHERTIHSKVRTEALLPGVNQRHDPFQCSKCNISFKDKNTLIRHLESVHEKSAFECNLCHQRFTREDNLQVHMRIHSGPPPRIICEICRQEFTSKLKLRSHRIDVHENSQNNK